MKFWNFVLMIPKIALTSLLISGPPSEVRIIRPQSYFNFMEKNTAQQNVEVFPVWWQS